MGKISKTTGPTSVALGLLPPEVDEGPPRRDSDDVKEARRPAAEADQRREAEGRKAVGTPDEAKANARPVDPESVDQSEGTEGQPKPSGEDPEKDPEKDQAKAAGTEAKADEKKASARSSTRSTAK